MDHGFAVASSCKGLMTAPFTPRHDANTKESNAVNSYIIVVRSAYNTRTTFHKSHRQRIRREHVVFVHRE